MDRLEKIKTLIDTYGQNDQRTEGWHAKRGQMLTASEIYKALPTASAAQKHELIMSKLTPKNTSNGGTGGKALIWGTRFEPIAKDIYSTINNLKIVDTTCIPHPTISFLGASPDGILITENTEDSRYGKLVEFKCPISRDFTNETPVPDGYYHQMQLQMECTGIDECDYVEMQFKELTYTEWIDNTTSEYKSFFAVSDSGDVIYKDFRDTRDPRVWREEVLKDKPDEYRILYWILNKHRTIPVKQQEDWLTKNLESFQSVWNEVLEYRKTGTFPQNPKDKGTLVL